MTGTNDTKHDEMDRDQKIIHAINNGSETAVQIADAVELSSGTVRKYLKILTDEGQVEREREGRSYRYYVDTDAEADGGALAHSTAAAVGPPEPEPEPAAEPEPDADEDGQMRVNRDYDWDAYRPDPADVHEYVQVNGELDEVLHLVENRDVIGHDGHFVLSGPTGAAKTTFGLNVAIELGERLPEADGPLPLFPIQCSDGMVMKDVIGAPTVVNDETWWVDGNGTKALLASQEQPVVLLLDEVNRVTSRIKSSLLSLLDDRAELVLDERGGEIIKGDPDNLIVISTMNRGPGYTTNRIDMAERRRLGEETRIKHLGVEDKAAEVRLVEEQTPVSATVAKAFVDAANEMREKADDSSAVQFGVTTALVLDWARSAYGRAEISDDPAMEAAEKVLINPFFGDDQQQVRTIEQIAERNVGGIDVTSEGGNPFEDVSKDDSILFCDDCGWTEDFDAVDEETAALAMCPECGGDLGSRTKVDGE